MNTENFKVGDCDREKVAEIFEFCPDGVPPILRGITISKHAPAELVEQINRIVSFLYQENEKLESERNLLQRIFDARDEPEQGKPENFSFSALDFLIILLAIFYLIAFFVILIEIFFHKRNSRRMEGLARDFSCWTKRGSLFRELKNRIFRYKKR